MIEQLLSLMTPQIAVTLLAAVAAFATTLTVLMPVLSRDRLSTRMQIMATERDTPRWPCTQFGWLAMYLSMKSAPYFCVSV